jgi:hypothetical protein
MGSTFYSRRLLRRSYVRPGRDRPKTFKTADKAKEYAVTNKISKYKITKLSDHKFRIDVE